MKAILHTTKGDVTIEFSSTDAQNTVANFVKLAKAGFYDGTKFHRVIQDFMIQGGDPLTKDDAMMARWGTGDPGYKFDDELYEGNHNVIGTISMANSAEYQRQPVFHQYRRQQFSRRQTRCIRQGHRRYGGGRRDSVHSYGFWRQTRRADGHQ